MKQNNYTELLGSSFINIYTRNTSQTTNEHELQLIGNLGSTKKHKMLVGNLCFFIYPGNCNMISSPWDQIYIIIG